LMYSFIRELVPFLYIFVFELAGLPALYIFDLLYTLTFW
jgi:hypothetical protein